MEGASSEAKILATKRNGSKGGEARALKLHGNASTVREAFYALLSERGPAILEKAAEQAIEGDPAARTFLYERAYGKAPQSIEVNATVDHKYEGQINIAVLTAELIQKLKDSKTQ